MKRSILVFLGFLVAFSIACGWFDDDVTNISYTETVPVGFPINADALCPGDAGCGEETVESPADQPLLPIKNGVDLDIIELTGNKELKKFVGVFRSIEITSIGYETKANDLSFDLPPMKLYLGPLGATSPNDDGVFELTTIPEIVAGTNKVGDAPVSEASRAATNDLFQQLRFATVLYAKPVVKKGQSFPPKGSTDLNLKLQIKFTANPQDAL